MATPRQVLLAALFVAATVGVVQLASNTLDTRANLVLARQLSASLAEETARYTLRLRFVVLSPKPIFNNKIVHMYFLSELARDTTNAANRLTELQEIYNQTVLSRKSSLFVYVDDADCPN